MAMAPTPNLITPLKHQPALPIPPTTLHPETVIKMDLMRNTRGEIMVRVGEGLGRSNQTPLGM